MPRLYQKNETVKSDAWLLYILRCFDGSLYTGITKDVDRRVDQHNAGKASRYTRSRRPVRVIYQEPHTTRSLALKREAAVKRMSRAEKESLIKANKATQLPGIGVDRAHYRRLVIVIALVFAGPGCAANQATGPRLRILGTVQDGGLPHAGCWCSHCRAARGSPAHARFVSSLALILPRRFDRPEIFLFDATPDIRPQLDLLHDLRPDSSRTLDRRPVDGVFLTHAHIGHYLGLAFFGYEAIHTTKLPVYCTRRMAEFLRTNGPWSQLVRIGNVQLLDLEHGKPVQLSTVAAGEFRVAITPLQVPHRDEYSDTVGFIIRREHHEQGESGPTVLFVPDTEPWHRWNPSLMEVIEQHHVTLAILDGTFYSADELPDRDATKIGHPLMIDTMDLLEPLVRAGRLKVYFTHLNHSNPALDPSSGAMKEIIRRGFKVAREGVEVGL